MTGVPVEKIGRLRGVIEFVAAAQAGSFSAAARQLDVSVAHVSRMVRSLETSTGVQLIHRTTRQSTLTEAGRAYYEQCRRLLDGLDEAHEQLRVGQATLNGSIRISMNGHYAETRLAPLLSAFSGSNPGISLDIETGSRNVDLVEERYDFAIRAGPLDTSSLIARRLISFPLVTLAAPKLIDRLGLPASPADLDPALCLALGDRCWTFARSPEVIAIKPAGPIRSNSGTVLVGAAKSGIGIIQVPAYYGVGDRREGKLVALFPDWTNTAEGFEFFIVYPPQQQLPARTRALIDWLVAGCAPES